MARWSRYNQLALLALLSVGAVSLQCGGTTAQEDEPTTTQAAVVASGRITGSYLELRHCFDAKTWKQEFRAMKRAGYDTVGISGVFNADTSPGIAYYAGSTVTPAPVRGCSANYDQLDAVLTAADAEAFSVYVAPLEYNGQWWGDNRTQAQTWFNTVVNDLHSRYRNHVSFKGWYLRQEVSLNNIVSYGTGVGEVLFAQNVAAHMDTKTPVLPILAPPYFQTKVGPEGGTLPSIPSAAQVGSAMTAYLNAVPQLDIIALQDGLGAGHTYMADIAPYFAAAGTAIGAKGKTMWGGIENFEPTWQQTGAMFKPARTPDVFADLVAVNTISQVSKMVTWIFQQYGSSSADHPVEGARTGDEQFAKYMVPSNWASTATYTLSAQPSTSYPDAGGRKLIDGVIGTTSGYGPFMAWTGVGPVTVTLNLGAVKEIKSISVHALSSTSSAVFFPTNVTATVSSDGVTYRPFGWNTGFAADTAENSGPVPGTDWATLMGYDSARYIKVTITPNGGSWMFLSELEVKGGGGTTNYNAARGKSYTLSPAPMAEYPDTNGQELTDGFASRDLTRSAGWYVGAAGTSLTVTSVVDLGMSASVSRAWIGTSAGNDGMNGACDYRPTSVAVFTSTNNSSWTNRGTDTTVGAWMGMNWTAASARYIKFVVTKTSAGACKDWLFIGEADIGN